jgi:hypothetical protein
MFCVALSVCGNSQQRMTLTFSAGSCTGTFTGFANLDPAATLSCSAANPFPGNTCGSYLGAVLITLGLDFPTGASTLAQDYLNVLGIGNIGWVQNLLIGHDAFTGATLQPTLFPNLAHVEGIFGISAFVNQIADIVGPVTGGAVTRDALFRSGEITRVAPLRYGLPGITVPPTGFGISALPAQAATLQSVGNLFTMFGTSFTDMASFASLKCVGTAWLSDNPTLTTFNGLNLNQAPAGGFIYDSSTASVAALTQPALTSLVPLMNCVGTTSPNIEIVSIDFGANPPCISSPNQICEFGFNGFAVCA